jgi:hypothetical protein
LLCDFRYFHTRRLHLLDLLKQLNLLLAMLFDYFSAVFDNPRTNPDLVRLLLSLWLGGRRRLARQGNPQLSPMNSEFSFHRLAQIPNQVKTVGDLNGLRGRAASPFGIATVPVPRDGSDVWVRE